MRKLLVIISTITIVIIIILSYWLGNEKGVNYGADHASEILEERKKARNPTSETFKPKYVKTLTVINKIHPIVLKGYGKVNASSSINISTEVQGVLNSSISLKKGTSFRKGQVLFTLKNTDAKLALQSKKSSFLTQLTTILPDLKIDYPESFNNWKTFFEKIEVSEPLPNIPKFKSTKEKSFIIARNILSQFYSIKSDEERLKKYTVLAPFSGSIIESYSESGATISPGMNVIKILRKGKLEIEIPILAKNLGLIKKGQEVQLQHNDGKIIFGSISRIGEYVNPSTQTFPVFVSINSNNNTLYNGIYLKSTINTNSLQQVAEIPRTAIFDDDYIYLINDKNQLVKQKILILTFQDETVLATGLADNTLVVSEAIVNAKEGATVSILTKK